MGLHDRFSHLPPGRQAAYRQMLKQSPTLTPEPFEPSLVADSSCRYRGRQRGTCELRRCCGQPAVDPVDVWECELLKGGCVLYGTPIESDIETCLTCSDRQPA
jgi:hypothetical protein